MKLVIADDHYFFRKGLQTTLDNLENIDVIGEAKNGRELLSVTSNVRPDIVITSVNMPEMDGIAATSLITERFPGISVIGISMSDDISILSNMIRAGAKGFLLKTADVIEISDAILTVSRNCFFCGSLSSKKMMKLISQPDWEETSLFHKPEFSKKEITIIKLICQQFSNKEIAASLGLSNRSIESTRERIQEKTGSRNMVGIVLYAIRNNYVALSEI